MKKKYEKITNGFVVQSYDGNKCIKQEFISSDDCTREIDGEIIDDIVIEKNEVYQNLDMVQPGFDYYILEMVGCVEPYAHGPFTSKEEQDKIFQEFISDERREEDNSFAVFKVSKGSEVIF